MTAETSTMAAPGTAICLHFPPCEAACPQPHTPTQRPTEHRQRCVCGTNMEYNSEEGVVSCPIASRWPPQ